MHSSMVKIPLVFNCVIDFGDSIEIVLPYMCVITSLLLICVLLYITVQ